jgi:hypothetical protein
MQVMQSEELVEEILRILSNHRMVLIVDNVDDRRALEVGGALHWVFRGLGNSRCLITSRISARTFQFLFADVKPGYAECFEIRPEDNDEVMEAMVARYAWIGGGAQHFPPEVRNRNACACRLLAQLFCVSGEC